MRNQTTEISKLPLISVIMSVYNEPIEWVVKAIDSILSQSYKKFEFIIINDNPERLENNDLLSSKKKQDSRITIINNEQNLGLASSLNIGINIAKGDFIARMDADDISLKDRFKAQVDYLLKHPEISICGTRAIIIDEKDKLIRKFIVPLRNESLKSNILFFCPFIHPTVMMRREIFTYCTYDPECRIGQDWNLWIHLYEHINFANLPQYLLLYR
ncbi:MAG: glycosyltransferase, partial [Bacilli bacterium]|nr:glycosyltransferase [Bacilli bacterium]